MGRVNRTLAQRIGRLAAPWVLPVALVVLLLAGLHARVNADPAPTASELSTYLKTNQLEARSQIVGDYQQVVYDYQDRTVQVSTSGYNHVSVMSNGPDIVWTGTFPGNNQIFLYNVLNDSLIQLTTVGSNQSPSVHNGIVTWQHWDEDHWQVYYYDGTTVQQLTNASTSSVRATSNGQQILYAQQLAPNDWTANSYDIASGQTTQIRRGDEASTAYPRFIGTTVKTSFAD